MKIIFSDGKVVEGELSSPKGTVRNPLSNEELIEKFFTMSSAVLPDEKLSRIIEKVDKIEAEKDSSTLATLLIAERNVDDRAKKGELT